MGQAAAERIEDALARSAGGDAPAFAEVVREYQAMVFSMAYHFLHDRAVAEDVAQEVFLELYQNLRAIKSSSHLKFWLRRVTGHRCIDQTRRRGGHRSLSLDEAPEPFRVPPDSDPVRDERLRQFVAALPEKRRMVVILRYQEELELHEIAEVMGMPINTVKSSLQRALAILREKLVRCLGDVHA